MGFLPDLSFPFCHGAIRVAHLGVAQGCAYQPDGVPAAIAVLVSPAHWARPSSRSTIPALHSVYRAV